MNAYKPRVDQALIEFDDWTELTYGIRRNTDKHLKALRNDVTLVGEIHHLPDLQKHVETLMRKLVDFGPTTGPFAELISEIIQEIESRHKHPILGHE